MMTALLAISFASNSMADTETLCYPFSQNQDGFNRVCITSESPQGKNSTVKVDLYRYERLVNSVVGQQVYNPQQRVCSETDPNFCYRKYEALRIVPGTQNPSDVQFEIFMQVHRPSSCLNGKVAVKEQLRTIELNVECPVRGGGY